MTTTTVISQQADKAIRAEFGSFILVSCFGFIADNEVKRTMYTVRKPNGKKLYRLVGYENGVVKAC